MNNWVRIAIFVMYWLFWLFVGWGIVLLAGHFGVAWSDALAPAYLIVFIGMGSAAYFAKRRRLLSEGKQAPRYLKTIFPVDPKRPIAFPRFLRILLGLVFLAFGILLALAMLFALVEAVHRPSFMTLLGSVFFGLISTGIVYVGWRLLFMSDNERMFRPIRPSED
jgi:hypothetical protein